MNTSRAYKTKNFQVSVEDNSWGSDKAFTVRVTKVFHGNRRLVIGSHRHEDPKIAAQMAISYAREWLLTFYN